MQCNYCIFDFLLLTVGGRLLSPFFLFCLHVFHEAFFVGHDFTGFADSFAADEEAVRVDAVGRARDHGDVVLVFLYFQRSEPW